MKILLLEDDLELCKNIKISLEKENYMDIKKESHCSLEFLQATM